MPRLILHTSAPSGLTLATVTDAPHRARVSVMQVVSISSLSSAIGTNTVTVVMAAGVAAKALVNTCLLVEMPPARNKDSMNRTPAIMAQGVAGVSSSPSESGPN